jgi:hypothetical protein
MITVSRRLFEDYTTSLRAFMIQDQRQNKHADARAYIYTRADMETNALHETDVS